MPAPARDFEMVRRYLAGETLQAIGNDYGLTRERVRQILRARGCESLGHRPEHCAKSAPLTADEIEAARLYSEGVRPREILSRFPHLRLDQVRRRTGTPKRKPAFSAKVVELYKAGVGATEIARTVPEIKFPTAVYRHLARAGVPARAPNGRNA